ncbi:MULTISPECIES: DUF2716 domain-containing protein [Bacillus]|uniref:DUF2716 domain-containing protein n=1 Tax=Bacillus TaxID=1386 RepID=UPI0009798710|nr:MULTISPECIES: DUF2716 domain-containing protein [Bacillus]AWD89669.1 DUF2716 domain-containing protein [Bacillus velezensis]AWM53583.1 DUF2716 domain-containing protein [Bacillus amyloliquefaciens]KAF6696130.1 DUF2716 domain-containing protein [Bacillus sp. EKM601B]MBA9147737.1 DUF2716 domain-containing protein [Bacillus sp. EKM213B]MDZ7433939.1 DUF2716 domain-containing protein [Bacillus amyloliquefaciens]
MSELVFTKINTKINTSDPIILTMNAVELIVLQILKALQSCTLKQEFIYALDWQHECYLFNPHSPIDKDEFGEWLVPVIPNGDYGFFIHQEFQWGLLGDPRQQTITIFGSPLIRAIERNAPVLFQK